MPDLSSLSERQRRMYEMIKDFILDIGYPPTVREICEVADVSSTSVVTYNLDAMEKKGLLSRERDVSRGIRLHEIEVQDEERLSEAHIALQVPFLGTIAAGEPIPVPDTDLADTDETVSVTMDMLPWQSGARRELYALRVKGDSMIDALIDDGDIVIVRRQPTANNGDMIVAWLKEERETTLKAFYFEPDRRRVRLQPRNPYLDPIYCDAADLEIQGKVVGVIRRYD